MQSVPELVDGMRSDPVQYSYSRQSETSRELSPKSASDAGHFCFASVRARTDD
jgi:hypothetical protein